MRPSSSYCRSRSHILRTQPAFAFGASSATGVGFTKRYCRFSLHAASCGFNTHLSTPRSIPFSSARSTSASRFHKPSVSTASGPTLSGRASSSSLPSPFSTSGALWASGGGLRRVMRLAITTSVSSRSPTMMSSSSRIGRGRDAKYARMLLMHEYDGLSEECRSTGAERWYDTDSA